jgi:hypothetical protein
LPPSTSAPSSRRAPPSAIDSGTNSTAPVQRSHSTSSGGSREPADRSSSRCSSSGASDHVSIDPMPPACGSVSAVPCSTDTGTSVPGSMSATRTATIDGVSAASI